MTIRKPHNLVTGYWDDIVHFLQEAESAVAKKGTEKFDILFPSEKRGMRYTILSSYLFLEAFINAEYFHEMGFKAGPTAMTVIQTQSLNEVIMNTYFDDKWSTWIEKICQKQKMSLKGKNEFQKIKKLKEWRNHLTHYKIHTLMLIANEIETIEIAREAKIIVIQAIQWYYNITKKTIPEWVKRDILNVE